jgi:hypothetical protein
MAGIHGESVMAKETCAACDDDLDDNAIKVAIGERIVDVCCGECAQRVREVAGQS